MGMFVNENTFDISFVNQNTQSFIVTKKDSKIVKYFQIIALLSVNSVTISKRLREPLITKKKID